MRIVLLSLLVAAPAFAQAPAPQPAKDWQASAVVAAPAVVGTAVDYTITVTPKSPLKIKAETPFAITLKTSDGLTAAKSKLDAKDFVDAKVDPKELKTQLTASKAGEHTVTAELLFFVCDAAKLCKRAKDVIITKVVVK